VEALRKYYPEQLARLQGLSDAVGIDLLKVVATSIYLPPLIFKGCTTGAAAPPATKDGEVYLVWSADLWAFPLLFPVLPIINIPAVLIGLVSPLFGFLMTIPLKQLLVTVPPLAVVSPPGKNEYIMLGIPLIAGIGLLNDKGLALVGNACGTSDCGDGLTAIEIPNLVMERCSAAKEAAEFIEGTERFSSSGFSLFNLNYLWGDAEGGIASVEATHNYFAVAYSGNESHFEYVNGEVVKTTGKSGILGQGNHHQYLDYHETGAPSPGPDGYQSSWMRCARMWELLRENYGNIDLQKAESFLCDRANGPTMFGIQQGGFNSICRTEFPIGWIDYYIGSINREYMHDGKPAWLGDLVLFGPDNCDAALVIQPKEKIIWCAAGWPTMFSFHPIYCAELLGVEGATLSPSDGLVTRLMNGGVKLFSMLGNCVQMLPPTLTTFLSNLIVGILKILAHIMEKMP
jgi:hypothetical protein